MSIQLIAQSKAGFFKQWSLLPHGLILPYGATSPKLISLLEKLGFNWVVGALEAPVVDGAYKSGPLMVWDAAPSGKPAGTVVKVWDERQMKEHPLDAWVTEIQDERAAFLFCRKILASTRSVGRKSLVQIADVDGSGLVFVDWAAREKYGMERVEENTDGA